MLPTDQTLDTSKLEIGVEKPNPPESTATAANYYGQLRRKARDINEIAVKEALFRELLRRKVGTRSIEEKALKLAQEERNGIKGSGQEEQKRGKGVNKTKWDKIVNGRQPEKVCDIIRLKMKYCSDAGKKAKKEYRRMKDECRKLTEGKTQQRKLDRVMAGIARATSQRWKEGQDKIRKKSEWLEKKFGRTAGISREEEGEERTARYISNTYTYHMVSR